LTAFFLALSCSRLQRLLTLTLAAAEGEQDIALHTMLCVLPAHCAQAAFAVSPPALACELFMGFPANAGLCCLAYRHLKY